MFTGKLLRATILANTTGTLKLLTNSNVKVSWLSKEVTLSSFILIINNYVKETLRPGHCIDSLIEILERQGATRAFEEV